MAEPIVQPERPGAESRERKNTTRAFAIFFALAAVLLVTERWVTQSPRFVLIQGDLGALAVTLDLAVAAPLLYWFIVVRGARVPGLTVIPVISLGLVAAGALLPDGHREVTRWGGVALAPAELAFGWWAVVRARAAMRRSIARGDAPSAGADFIHHLRSALRESVRIPVVADALAFELALIYYALFSWRATPHVPPGAVPFTTHKKSGVIALLVVGAFITVIEATVVHLLVQRWSHTVAWVVTALSIYGVFWILGFLQAIRLRPILLTDDSLLVRLGMLSSVIVPFKAIASVTRATYPYPDRRAPGYLRAMLTGDLHFLVQLNTPLRSEGAYGRRREVRLIGLAVDEPAEFLRLLEDRVQRAATQP